MNSVFNLFSVTIQDFLDSWFFVFFCFGFIAFFIWWALKFGGVETGKQYENRQQREADDLAAMDPEQRRLHLNARHKVAEFKYQLGVFLIVSLASLYLIILCVK